MLLLVLQFWSQLSKGHWGLCQKSEACLPTSVNELIWWCENRSPWAFNKRTLKNNFGLFTRWNILNPVRDCSLYSNRTCKHPRVFFCYTEHQSISKSSAPLRWKLSDVLYHSQTHQRSSPSLEWGQKIIILFLPAEQRWAQESSREVIASPQCEGWWELQERTLRVLREAEIVLQGGLTRRGRVEWGGVGWGKIGELTCWRGQSTSLSPLQTHLSLPCQSRREIFVFITAGWLQGLQVLPTCLF